MRYWLGLVLLPLLSACSGAGLVSAPTPQKALPEAVSLSEAQSDGVSRSSAATQVPYSADLLYVANAGNNSITVYQHDISGNTAPKYVIAGSKTGLTSPGQLSEDAVGNLYVANGRSVLVFAHGSRGNVAPIRALSGQRTGIHNVLSMTVDRVTGKIVIADEAELGDPYSTSVIRFPANASGNTAPFAIKIQLRSDVTSRDRTEFSGYGADILLYGTLANRKSLSDFSV